MKKSCCSPSKNLSGVSSSFYTYISLWNPICWKKVPSFSFLFAFYVFFLFLICNFHLLGRNLNEPSFWKNPPRMVCTAWLKVSSLPDVESLPSIRMQPSWPHFPSKKIYFACQSTFFFFFFILFYFHMTAMCVEISLLKNLMQKSKKYELETL